MRNITTIATAAMAISLTVASVPPAAATNDGVSEKRVRTLIKQEVAKITRGLGPAGPAGIDGVRGQMRFAHVFSNGEVDTERARGISRENVVAGEIRDPEDGVTLHRLYCFVGLPTPLGGQVSGDLDPGDFDANDEHLDLYGFENCSPLVLIDEPPDSPRITGFQVLLLY